ncbi:MAG: thiol reductant ABC exporter subunit CydD [Omnitrophica WOR_2 bacterium]
MKLDRRLLRLLASVHLAFLLTLLLGFAGGVLAVLQASLLSKIVSRVFLDGLSLAEVAGFLALLLLVILLKALFAFGAEAASGSLAARIKQDLRTRFYRHLLDLGPLYTRNEQSGELVTTAVEGIEALDAYFSQYLPQLVFAALVPLAVLFFVFPLDLISGLVLLLTAPLIPIFMALIGSLAEALTQKQWLALSRMSAYFLDVIQGLPTLKILGISREQVRVIAGVSERFRTTTMQVLRVTFLSALILELVATLSTALVAVEIGLRLLYSLPGRAGGLPGISFEQAFFILILAPEFYLPLRMLGARFHSGMAGVTAAKRIFVVLETPAGSTPSALRVPQYPFPIRFCNAGYTYADGRIGLQEVSFEAQPGEKIALVGVSGSGKTTMAHLLLRFMDPDRGEIYAGDTPLRQIPGQDWRTQIACVPQNPYLFNDTVSANIRLGLAGASQVQVEEAARLSHAHEFICKLPQGYETPIGERGSRLSGGQAQCLNLARAFLRRAPVLILDEYAANLDPLAQARIDEAMQRLMIGKTVFLIAHRLSTVTQADQILVLSGGRVVEAGRHQDLLAVGGLYHRLVAASQGAV